MIFNAELISEAISNFGGFAKEKIGWPPFEIPLRPGESLLSFVFEIHISF